MPAPLNLPSAFAGIIGHANHPLHLSRHQSDAPGAVMLSQRSVLLWSMICLITIGLAAAAEPQAEPATTSIQAEAAWARATRPSASVGAGYLNLVNTGATDDAIIAARSPRCGRMELHTHILEGEVMRMVEIERIELPAQSTTHLRPGSLHLMFFDLEGPLVVGETFAVILSLKSGSELTVSMIVGGATARNYEEARSNAGAQTRVAPATDTPVVDDCCGGHENDAKVSDESESP
ncbi:MAG: copper chaperone PCu(A)C [Planctomycetota bacterium]|nr:MAG: copper chaperone PCu(A)C [Planctomycetota bacterium]